MAVFKIKKTDNYTVMSNHHLRDKKLSLKAIGLLSKMLSLPDEWDYSMSGLVAICKEQRSAVESAIKELKKHGYMTIDKLMPNETESGRIEYVYNIYEHPVDVEKQDLENLCLESQGVEKPQQLNKEKSNKEKLKKEDMYADVPAEIKDVFMEWVAMRKQIKKPIVSKQSVTRALNKLNQLAEDPREQIKLIELATDKCWLGFYPPKQEKAAKSAYTPPEPPRYRPFEPDPEVEVSQMPEEMRNKYRGFIDEL